MGTVKLLWFFTWRMALLGLASRAALGGVYGAALLAISGLYEEFSTNLPGEVPMGPVQVVLAAWLLAGFGGGFGALIGAPVGLALGALGGLVVVALTLAAYRSPPPDGRGYREAAGLSCAVAALLALAADWALHGFPDASTVVFWRLLPFETMESERGSNEGFWLVGVIPTLAAVLAMWWAGRKVAGWYARRNRGASG
ncbi:MAG TPA: hypothetical protein VGR18_05875 [Rubrobacter sp.]|nr:hypothetical protein [Rubrobacter sp.]